jgi:D-arabinose 1-dehydrogenase-like Zn-dependent alcohol dehydrogenase
MTVMAFGAMSATDPLAPMTIERRDLGPHDVRIAIRYAGICAPNRHQGNSSANVPKRWVCVRPQSWARHCA